MSETNHIGVVGRVLGRCDGGPVSDADAPTATLLANDEPRGINGQVISVYGSDDT